MILLLLVAMTKASMVEIQTCRLKISFPIDQLFVFAMWLKNGLNLNFTSWLFDLKPLVSRMLISRINYIYFSLGTIPTWPTKDQIH